MENLRIFWKDKDIEMMTRDELISVIKEMDRMRTNECNERDRRRQVQLFKPLSAGQWSV